MKTDLIKGKAKSQFGEYFRRRSAKQLRFRLNEDGLGTTSFIQHILAVALGAHTDAQRFSTASRARKDIPATTQEYECEHISTISSLASRPLAWCSQAQPWTATCNVPWLKLLTDWVGTDCETNIAATWTIWDKWSSHSVCKSVHQQFASENMEIDNCTTWFLSHSGYSYIPKPQKNPNHQTPRHFRGFFCKIPLISHLFGFNFIEAILHFDTSVLHPFRGKLGMVYDIVIGFTTDVFCTSQIVAKILDSHLHQTRIKTLGFRWFFPY